MRYFISILLLIGTATNVYSQITLNRFSDPKKHGYESIVFVDSLVENASLKKITKYNLEANNPYNDLPFDIKTIKSTGSKTFRISQSQAADFFNVNTTDIDAEGDILLSSHFFVRNNKNNVVIGYNLFGYNSQHYEAGLRKSTIKVLNRTGEEIFRSEIESDCYELHLTPNGKYLSYAYGEATHDISFNSWGFKMVKIDNSEVVLNIKGTIDFIYTKYNYLIIRGWDEGSKNMYDEFYNWILDYEKNEIYKIDGNFITSSPTSFEKRDKSQLIEDLTTYKIK